MWMLILVCVFVPLLWNYMRKTRDYGDLDRIPGPDGNPWLNVFKRQDDSHEIPHLMMTELAQKYGPIFKIPSMRGGPLVVVTTYDLLHQVLVSSGKEFGGRQNAYRIQAAFGDTGILLNIDPDSRWRLLRKISQRHLHQFGDGLSRLEALIMYVAEDLYREFEEHEGRPYNPKPAIAEAVLNSIAFLISGVKIKGSDPLHGKLKKYHDLATTLIPAVGPISQQLLDAVPFVRFFGNKCWKSVLAIREQEQEVWTELSKIMDENPETESIYKTFQDYLETQEASKTKLTKDEVIKTCLQLLLGGFVTTNPTFYAAVNLLAHHPQVPERMHAEIALIVDGRRDVKLTDRPELPYCRAVLYEILRYQSVSPMGSAHRARVDTTLAGLRIPANTRVVALLYMLHHDADFWGDPEQFRPERFLGDDGQLLPVDHPHRKHLMPFGAGTRVCLAESFATARLFLWLTNMVRLYTIRPAPGNTKANVDMENFRFAGVLVAPEYEVIFQKRQ